MKSSFSRTFFPAAVILLLALLLVGTSFQFLVRDYLTDTTLSDLENDGKTIARLASAYYTQNSISDQDFLVNLSIATQISSADAVICDEKGILCVYGVGENVGRMPQNTRGVSIFIDFISFKYNLTSSLTHISYIISFSCVSCFADTPIINLVNSQEFVLKAGISLSQRAIVSENNCFVTKNVCFC